MTAPSNEALRAELEPKRLRAERGGPMDGYDLYVGEEHVGYVYEKVQHYNLIRVVRMANWQVNLKDHKSFDGGERFREAMSAACRVLGAQEWGRGKRPRVWTPR